MYNAPQSSSLILRSRTGLGTDLQGLFQSVLTISVLIWGRFAWSGSHSATPCQLTTWTYKWLGFSIKGYRCQWLERIPRCQASSGSDWGSGSVRHDSHTWFGLHRVQSGAHRKPLGFGRCWRKYFSVVWLIMNMNKESIKCGTFFEKYLHILYH